ncbi:ankyrin repeat-containing domain protein [Pavlovales sp. CCMP2436]|nr:ankyrin repeat-containing domain protein [Pavlovales sp. CCMP2436]
MAWRPQTADEASAAAEAGDVAALASYCAQRDIDVDKPVDPATGETLLHVASAAGQDASVKMLIDAGCKLAVLDNDDQNALHYACNEGAVNVARLLVANGIGGAEINRLDKYQMSPLHLAVEGGHLDMVKFLTALPQVDEKIRRGSVSFIAARHEHTAIAELLARGRETLYDEHGNFIGFTPSDSAGSLRGSISSSVSGGRTAAARRRSRLSANEEDGGSVKSSSTMATSTRAAPNTSERGAYSAHGASALGSRSTTPQPTVSTTVRRDKKLCGGCAIA